MGQRQHSNVFCHDASFLRQRPCVCTLKTRPGAKNKAHSRLSNCSYPLVDIALSFDIEADRYRQNNRKKTVANSETENTKIYLYALRQPALLEKGRRASWTGHVSEAVILGQNSRALLFWLSDL